ncbi:hypothetical protein ISF6_0257 [Piscinibacter sakaiensis]|nr:hypothetical protein ISF6_0257 [Piscinibacter sakaiensis]
MCRDDALVQVLNKAGYNPILLPRTGLEPPEIYLYEQGVLRRWGRLATAVPAGSLPDTLQEGEQADISHSETSRKSLQAAGNFLNDALRCIGVNSAPKLDLSFARGAVVTFSFSGVTWRGLDPADIGAALNQGFDPAGLSEEKLRLGMVHVAYDYAYADAIDMTLATDGSAKVDVQALNINGFIDLGGKAECEVKSSTTISFKGKGKPAAFACKLGQVKRAKNRWTFNAREVVGQGFAPEEGAAEPYLLRRGQVLIVEDMQAT